MLWMVLYFGPGVWSGLLLMNAPRVPKEQVANNEEEEQGLPLLVPSAQ